VRCSIGVGWSNTDKENSFITVSPGGRLLWPFHTYCNNDIFERHNLQKQRQGLAKRENAVHIVDVASNGSLKIIENL
jgi:hypothetical protein